MMCTLRDKSFIGNALNALSHIYNINIIVTHTYVHARTHTRTYTHTHPSIHPLTHPLIHQITANLFYNFI